MSSGRLLAALVILGLIASGCRLDLTAATELDGDGTGTVALIVRMDDELLGELDGLGVDPTAELTAAVAQADGWTMERSVTDEQALEIRVWREVDRPADIGTAFRELSSGLAAGDPSLSIDLEAGVAPDGRASVQGTVGFRSPATAGVVIDGEPLGPSPSELGAMIAEVVTPRLRITLPGPIAASDGDQVEGRTVTWDIPVDGSRVISASSDNPPIYEEPWVWGIVVAALVLVVVAVAAFRRRRAAVTRRAG